MADQTLKEYNFREVNTIVGGFAISGFAEDGGILIEFSEDVAQLQVGADGEKTAVQYNDDSATLVLTLMQSSGSMDVLNAFWAASRQGRRFPVLIQDGRGRTLVSSKSCFVTSRPDIEFSKDAGEREWRIAMPFPKVIQGGSDSDGGLPGLPSFPGISLPF